MRSYQYFEYRGKVMKTNRLKKIISIALLSSMVSSMVACGNKDNAGSASTNTPTNSSSPSVKVDPLAKYDPPIEITAWRYTNAGIKYENGDTIDNNIYTKAYLEKLGIKLTYKWVVPQDQFQQKLNISIASGDLPDIMWLNNTALTSLAENDLLYDLTNLFKNNTSQLTKDIMMQDETSFNTAKIGGKLVAMPYTGSAIDSLQVMYARQDWLQKLGLAEPKTMQDVLAIANAFAKKDPDGNGKDDTFGMALVKSFLTETHANATGFFVGYHAYPKKWVKDASGKLAYGSIQPEVKTALKQLQDMYKDGLIDKEFGVKDRPKVVETLAAGKVGLQFGGMSSPGSVLQSSVDNDPKAEWKAYPIPSIDSKVATPIAKMPISLYYGVNKKTKYPDAIMKLIEFGTEGYSDKAQADSPYGTSKTGVPVYLYSAAGYEPAKKNLNAHLNILEALKVNNDAKLSGEEKGYYNRILDYRNGNRKNWGQDRIFGTPSSFDVINQYVESKNMIYDGFYGSPTPTMVEKSSTLDKMEEEVFTKIIMGQSIDSFDKFVEDWKKLGGDQIIKEINDWAAKNK
jgi:putative aldouronate transport system substrate-binding protein